jgi:exonuclease SbcC
MLPIRLEIKNFLPYRAPDPVRFDGIHLACLTGANGAGKSSLLDAVTWALWGKARARRDEDLMHLGQQDMYVQLDFEQEGQLYRVIRRRTRRQRGSGTLDLLVWDKAEDAFNLISEPNMRATQERIDTLLRLDYETFCNSAFLQQGKADAFTTRTPKERKQILSDILGLARWEQYEEIVREHIKRIDRELDVITLRIHEINDDLAKEPGLKTSLVEARRAEADARQAVAQAEAHLKTVEHAPENLQQAHERLAETQRRAQERQVDLQAINATIERHQAAIASYQAVIDARAEIESGYASLQAAREADHSLADKLLQITDFDQQQHQLETTLNEARARLENEASGHLARIAELERQRYPPDHEEVAALQVEVHALQALEAERESLQAQASQMGEERAELEATNRALRTEMFNLKDRLDRLQHTETATCPLCGQPLDEAHRASLIDQLTLEGTQRGDTFRTNEKRIRAIQESAREQRQQLGEIEVELKRLQPLMERAGALNAQMAAAQEAAARLENEQASLQAVRALLDNDDFAHDTRQQLQALQEHRAAIGYDRESHTAARQQLTTYSEYEKRQAELDLALKLLPETQAALDDARLRAERTRQVIHDEERAIASLEAEIIRLGVLLAEYQARREEVERLRTVERNALTRVINIEQELDSLKNERERKAELEQRAEQKRYEAALYKELRVAFSKNGIPAMIIETAIPELENAANSLLSRMTGGRMHLRFSTQREKITGGVAETLDIEIADELGTRGYELYSGGEAFRIDFAIRVALSQMLARRAGAHLRTLFIDEGFGTQDADGRDRLVEAITAIQDDFDMILVITHIDELRDSFPVHVLVDKTPGGSRITIR